MNVCQFGSPDSAFNFSHVQDHTIANEKKILYCYPIEEQKCPEFPSLLNQDIVKQTETFKISEVKRICS